VDVLDSIIKRVYNIGFMIVVCGDCSIIYLSENVMRKQLYAVSYNLSSSVDFPERIHNKSSRAIDNIFINTLHFNNILITALVIGLSDHDVQLLTINEINLTKQQATLKLFGL
jgi:hypothetical protein